MSQQRWAGLWKKWVESCRSWWSQGQSVESGGESRVIGVWVEWVKGGARA